jgi:hypothetical protein
LLPIRISDSKDFPAPSGGNLPQRLARKFLFKVVRLHFAL